MNLPKTQLIIQATRLHNELSIREQRATRNNASEETQERLRRLVAKAMRRQLRRRILFSTPTSCW